MIPRDGSWLAFADSQPFEGQIVFVDGGVAQYRDGAFYTGMEDPRYARKIMWPVTHWMPMNAPKGGSNASR